MTPGAAPTYPTTAKVGFGPRLVAILIDAFLVVIIGNVLASLLIGSAAGPSTSAS